MKYKHITSLDVYYNVKKVGLLKQTNESIYFQYDENWINNGFSISPISLPLTRKLYVSSKPYFEGVFGVFYDSLPDGWGRLLLNRYFAKDGLNYETLPILDKLSLIGPLSKGALTYKPNQFEEKESNRKNLDEISKMFKEIYDDEIYKNLDEAFLLGGSSGGARPKAYINIDEEEWIIKFPSKMDPENIGEKEYNANKLAKECDINTNEFKLFPSKLCNGYFGAKRFDRKNGKRIHMISLSSLLETSFRIPNLDYTILFEVTKMLTRNIEDQYEIYRRMCFNVLFQNKDDHGNNFSFIYDEINHTYKISPFYDVTFTPKKAEHEMCLLGKINPNEDDLIKIIPKIKLDKDTCLKIINKIKNKMCLVSNDVRQY